MHSLRLDMKQGRIYLNDHAMRDLGNPKYVEMWIRQSDMTLLFVGSGTGVRVNNDEPGQATIYSKQLLRDIQAICGDRLRSDCSYRMKGESRDGGICFSMDTTERIIWGTGDRDDSAADQVCAQGGNQESDQGSGSNDQDGAGKDAVENGEYM